MKHRILNILSNTFFIALVLFAIVFVFIPEGMFQKHKIDLVLSEIIQENSFIFYEDLDSDGKSEKIRRYIDPNGMNALNVYLIDGTIVDQFNFGREAVLSWLFFAYDRDNNGFKEIYDLSHSNDSIFLNWVEPLNENDNVPHSVFVTTMPYNRYGNIDYDGRSFQIADLNNDGYNEILFSVTGGYSKFPRRIFAYDFENDSICSSPFTGAKCYISEIKDINDDGYPEVILSTSANANIQHNDTILDDEHSYLIVLDHNLNFQFKPVSFYGYPSGVRAFAGKTGENWFLFGIFHLAGVNGESQKLFMYDIGGEEIKHIEIPGKGADFIRSKTDTTTFVLIEKNGRISFYDEKLDKKYSQQVHFKLKYQFDLDRDGNYEWIDYSADNTRTVYVYTFDFSECTTVTFPIGGKNKYCFKISGIQSPEKGLFQVQKDEYNYIYKYYKNKYYYLRFPFYCGIYLFLLLVVYVIQRLQRYQTERKMAIEKQISELQLKTVRSQMDPHFTFNALNSINNIIYKEDKKTAQRYFTKFSKLVRSTLEVADKITRTLEDEIEFTSNYLALEKLRFKEKLNYEINVAGNVDKSLHIPKMIIQIYAENAIKHGLKYKEKDGLLKIDVSQEDSILRIVIEDNGIGRKKAAELNTRSTGKGMKIMKTIGELYYKLYKSQIRQTIDDLYDENGNPSGTRVTVEIISKPE